MAPLVADESSPIDSKAYGGRTNVHPLSCSCGMTPRFGRRQVLKGLGGAAAAFACAPALAAAPAPARIIDVHHHFHPTLKNAYGREWSPAIAIEELDKNGVAAAIAWCGPMDQMEPAAARKTARDWNDWATKTGSDHPGRFGLFASLPFRDTEGSLSEIAYAFDVLKADGIGLTANYGDLWLGDDKFQPIYEELNRRSAVVYVHPDGAPCCTPATMTYMNALIRPPSIEYPVNSARTILSLLASGTTRRFPKIKFIFCHGGGVMPLIVGRVDGLNDSPTAGAEKMKAVFPEGIYAEYRKFYFECAQAYAPETITMVRSLVPSEHILFGTDYSYFPVSHSIKGFAALDLPSGLRQAIASGNAEALLPRWKV